MPDSFIALEKLYRSASMLIGKTLPVSVRDLSEYFQGCGTKWDRS